MRVFKKGRAEKSKVRLIRETERCQNGSHGGGHAVPTASRFDVNFQELDRPIAYMSAFLRVPIPMQRSAWRCHACDAEWADDGDGAR